MLLSAPPLPGWCLRGPQLAERCIVQRQHSSPWRDRGHTWLSNVGEGRHPADCRLGARPEKFRRRVSQQRSSPSTVNSLRQTIEADKIEPTGHLSISMPFIGLTRNKILYWLRRDRGSQTEKLRCSYSHLTLHLNLDCWRLRRFVGEGTCNA